MYKNPEDIWVASWPDQFSVEGLLRLRETDPYIFSCQQMNNPRDESVVDFKPKWLKYFQLSDDQMNILAEI
jgi:hypothetical protein